MKQKHNVNGSQCALTYCETHFSEWLLITGTVSKTSVSLTVS